MVNNIKLERLKLNLKQQDIAEYLQINVNTYRKKEKYIGEFTAWELKALAKKYNCTVDYLIETMTL